MKECHQFYINGEWVEPLSSELIEVENPTTEKVIGTIASGTKEDIDNAVRAAKNAFSTFGESTKDERISILESIIKAYEARQEELAKTISEEMGAPIWLSNVAQVTSGLAHFKDTCRWHDYSLELANESNEYQGCISSRCWLHDGT